VRYLWINEGAQPASTAVLFATILAVCLAGLSDHPVDLTGEAMNHSELLLEAICDGNGIAQLMIRYSKNYAGSVL